MTKFKIEFLDRYKVINSCNLNKDSIGSLEYFKWWSIAIKSINFLEENYIGKIALA